MPIQFIFGLIIANFVEWLVHKYVLHKLGKMRTRFLILGKKKIFVFLTHWNQHHRISRKNDFRDSAFSFREIFGIFILLVIAFPIWFILPGIYYGFIFSAMLYLLIHNISHKYPEFSKKYIRWHYDHHMGKNQNKNWCVTYPLADYLLGTRIKYEYRE
jgi:sterol desaturase/sphingolipid hydroxylase (fatty acid hydroxylase superfamily)